MDAEIIETCPRRWIKDEPKTAADMFWFYKRYDKGLLPEDGGLQSQPNKLMQVMRIMEAAYYTVEDEEDKKRKRLASVGAAAGPKRNPYANRVAPDGKPTR